MLSNDELLLQTDINKIVSRIDANVDDAKRLMDTRNAFENTKSFSSTVGDAASFAGINDIDFYFPSFDLDFSYVIDSIFNDAIDIVSAFENKIEDIIKNIGLDIKRIIAMFTNFSLSRVTAIIKARMIKFIKKIIQNIIDKVKEKLLKVFEKLVKFYARITSLIDSLHALAESIAATVTSLKSEVLTILNSRKIPYSDQM